MEQDAPRRATVGDMNSEQTVAAVLADHLQADAQIVLGGDTAWRSVTGVWVAPAADELGFAAPDLHSGEVAIVSRADTDARSTPTETVDPAFVALRSAGAAAVIVAARPNELAATVLRELLAQQTRRIERVFEIHERIAASAVSGGGTRDIIEALHDLVRHPIVLVDGDDRLLAAAPADTAVPRRTTRGGTQRFVRHPVTSLDESEIAIIVLANPEVLEPDAMIAIEQAATAIATRQAEARAITTAQERFAAFALEELISGQAKNRAELADRAASLGWDLDLPRAVLLASIDPPTDARTAGRVLGTIASAARSTLGRHAIVWTRSTTVAALIAPISGTTDRRRPLALALKQELDERVRGVTISIGVGQCVADPLDLPDSFAQARRAVDVGRWAKGRHVTELFDELGLERLLAACPAEELTAYVEHTIGPLQEYDAENKTDLVNTLGAWLDTRNVAEASRRTFVHYNTFKNRLERIESILGPVTTDPAKSVECAVALHIARHHEVHSR